MHFNHTELSRERNNNETQLFRKSFVAVVEVQKAFKWGYSKEILRLQVYIEIYFLV